MVAELNYKNSSILDNLGDEARQQIQFQLLNGKLIFFTFFYSVNNNAWFVDMEYEDFILYGLRIVNNASLLRQYNNILPFDIEVTSVSGFNPYTIDCFKNGLNTFIINEFEDE